jgi:hypothetical protein
MATYEKPTSIPRWDDDETNLTEPSEGKKDIGWEVDEIPPSSWENWKSNLIGNWFKWIDERIVDANAGDGWSILDPKTGDVAWGLDNSGVNPYLWTEIEDFAFFGSGTEPKITFQTSLFPGHEASISYDRTGDWFTIRAHDEDVLILTVDSARFLAGYTLYPATGGTGNLGNASHYWDSLYCEHLYQKNPLFWSGILSDDVAIAEADAPKVITPESVKGHNEISVSTSPAGKIIFAHNGWYLINCMFTVRINGTNGILIVQEYLNGVAVDNTCVNQSVDSTSPITFPYTIAVPITDYENDYVEIKGDVAGSGSIITVYGGSGTEIYSHMTITSISVQPDA